MPDLSVLIPARNEQWLGHTVRDVLAHAKADTEIIVVLDGAWPIKGYELAQDPRVQVVYVPESIGQRAATNLAARVSRAEFVMKLDGHSAMADGFDVELIRTARDLGRDVTQIPAQHNLHVFDWVCDGCAKRTYQGPTPTECDHCHGHAFHRDVVWNAVRRQTRSWAFDSDLKFQYWGGYESRPEAKGQIADVLSCLGACWFLSRERFWALGGLDEGHGSWGQMGTEVACLSWLSGGRLVVNKRTWFSHLFRTQGGDFSFPYELSGRQVDHARKYSNEKWKGGRWGQQQRSLRWLLDLFWPVPGWSEEQRRALPGGIYTAPDFKHSAPEVTKGIVYYSDGRPSVEILAAAQRTIERSGLPIVAVTLQPMTWPAARTLVLEGERGILTMFEQILAGLEALDTDLVFLCEHDVIYHPSHFAYTPTDRRAYHYNANVWKVSATDGRALHYRCNQTSGLCADRRLLLDHYRARVAAVRAHGYSRRNGFEPGTRQIRHGGFDDHGHVVWMAETPNIDIRHGQNLTPSRWRREQFRNQKYTAGWTEGDAVPGWGVTAGRFDAFLADIVSPSAAAEAA